MNQESKISYDDFKKVEVKVGKILSVEKVEGSEKLLKLSVSFGLKPSSFKEDGSPEHLAPQDVLGKEQDVRQIVSGIAKYFPDEVLLVGKKCMFVTNLEPRMIMGLESNGMLFALGGGDTPFSLIVPANDVQEGTPAN